MNTSDQSRITLGTIFKAVIPICIIAAGLAAGYYLKSSRPEIKRKPPVKQVAVVETISLSPGRHQGTIHAMGTVVPEKQVELKARVSGEVIAAAKEFVEGGRVKKGELLLTLEDSDYRIDLDKARSALDKAVSDLAIEQGSQMVAKEELKLIMEASGEQVPSTDLALRKPQLAQAQAAVKSAQADLEKARLNLSRTRIEAPFNALILETSVDKGAFVSAQASLCTLVDLDTFNIEAQVAPDRLSSFVIDENSGSRAQISSQYSGQIREGRVVRMTGKMSDESRMAGVIIQVSDPLGITGGEQAAPLLLDDHVSVRIMGRVFENVYRLPRKFFRENQTVWILKDGALGIRKVGIAWKEDGEVFVSSGIHPEDKIITTDIPAPVDGMALRDADSKEAPAEDAERQKS